MPFSAENHLIEILPRAARKRLLALCEPVHFALAQVLFQPGEVLRYVFFPIDGFASLVTVIDNELELEIGMVGREGMLGAHVALGVFISPARALVLGPGSAWRVSAAAFKRELLNGSDLANVLFHYLYVLSAQQTAGAACQHYHLISARLARWLLMSQDRAHTSRFHVTHELLATLLGVRRVGITAAAGALQRDGAIRYHRGNVEVVSRELLELAACGCYVADGRTYANQIG